MPGAIDYTQFRIQPDPDTQEWWDGTKQHKLLVRQCKSCGYQWFPPYPTCARCRSMDLTWHETSGRGVIACYIVVVQPVLQAFAEAVPYAVALVELPECENPDGTPVRLVGVMVDDEDAVAIGLPVQVQFDHAPDDSFVVPRWPSLTPNPLPLPILGEEGGVQPGTWVTV